MVSLGLLVESLRVVSLASPVLQRRLDEASDEAVEDVVDGEAFDGRRVDEDDVDDAVQLPFDELAVYANNSPLFRLGRRDQAELEQYEVRELESN